MPEGSLTQEGMFCDRGCSGFLRILDMQVLTASRSFTRTMGSASASITCTQHLDRMNLWADHSGISSLEDSKPGELDQGSDPMTKEGCELWEGGGESSPSITCS